MNGASRSDATRRLWSTLAVALTSLALLFGAAVPAAAAELMRVTFVRHGQSAGNASGLIDTSTPGPVLTPLGQQQAQDVVGTLGDNNYDAIYASTMVRTQLTAAPMSQYLRLPITVLPGLQEVEAGVFEGTPEANAANGYAKFPLAWAFQGNLNLRIPGSIDGNEFDARMDGALQHMYDNGDRNPVVFSHGAAIMFWTMINAQNLTLEQKINLLRTAPLGNTDYVVIEGNPEDGWTLVNWNGQAFSPEPTLGAEVQRQVRTLVRQLTATAQQVSAAFATGNLGTVLTAINQGVADAVFSVVKFGRAVNAKVIQELETASTPAPAASTSTLAAASTVSASAARTVEPEPSPAPKPQAVEASKSTTATEPSSESKSKSTTTEPAKVTTTDPAEVTTTDPKDAVKHDDVVPAERDSGSTQEVHDSTTESESTSSVTDKPDADADAGGAADSAKSDAA
jgi:broad specificity phosphatase PhoE